MVDVNGSSGGLTAKSTGFVWGLAATRRSVYIHQMNRVNSRNDFGHDDSTINIVVVIIIIIQPSDQQPRRHSAIQSLATAPFDGGCHKSGATRTVRSCSYSVYKLSPTLTNAVYFEHWINTTAFIVFVIIWFNFCIRLAACTAQWLVILTVSCNNNNNNKQICIAP